MHGGSCSLWSRASVLVAGGTEASLHLGVLVLGVLLLARLALEARYPPPPPPILHAFDPPLL